MTRKTLPKLNIVNFLFLEGVKFLDNFIHLVCD